MVAEWLALWGVASNLVFRPILEELAHGWKDDPGVQKFLDNINK